MTALVFDCDGVLADTERHGHLPAFNQAFADFGLPVRWSEDDYGALLGIGGGKERVGSLLTPTFVADNGLPAGDDGKRDWLARFHSRKTAIYRQIVAGGGLPARPGVRRVVDSALAAGWQVAVASTSAEESVRTVLEQVLPPDHASRLEIFAGDVVPAKKPDPGIYRLALERLGARPDETLVIEDSRNGLLAAARAGLTCVITVSSYTAGEDFSEAALVVSSLGDPGEPMHVLANRTSAEVGELVSLADLAAVLNQRAVEPNHSTAGPVVEQVR